MRADLGGLTFGWSANRSLFMARLDRAISLREMEDDTRGLADGPFESSHDDKVVVRPLKFARMGPGRVRHRPG
jgi:alpha-D-ribose 1-methylphosphonate 5-triphosphate synthase subunit PhnI